MIYDRWVSNFIKNYKEEIKLETLVANISHSLLFNDTPSLKLIKLGEVDCVAAAAITSSILNFFFPSYKFNVVSLPRLPWLEDINDSKHCAVVQFFNSVPIFIIDSTPINGYGYGKISKRIKITEWQRIDNGWRLKKQAKISNCKFWDEYIYPEFLLMTEDDITKIFKINNIRFFIKNNSILKINFGQPKNNIGWIKEYWRTRAQLAVINKEIKKATRYYAKALNISPLNPYLLKEIISFCKQNKIKGYFDLVSLKKKQNLSVNKLVRFNKVAISVWNREKERCFLNKHWNKYLYYLGNIYWREQSISLLKGKTPDKIPIFEISKIKFKAYKLSPYWFKSNHFGVFVSKNKIIDKNIVCQAAFKINFEYNDFYNNFLKIKIRRGYVYIVKREFCFANSAVFEELLAHRQFLGLIKPELIII